MRKYIVAILITGAVALFAPKAVSHGDAQPQHGGIVQVKNDLHFELVRDAAGVSLYVFDHGEPLVTEGIAAQLLILAEGKKSEVQLTKTGPGKFYAPKLQLAAGAKVVATIKDETNKTVTVRYSL